MIQIKEHTARFVKAGKRFEVVIDPDKALKFRDGECELEDALLAPYIFSDYRKGEWAKEEDLKSVFGTTDVDKIAERIIKEGELQLTEEYRKKLREEKLNKIVYILSREAVDPRTKLPHPPDRIRRAIEENRIHVDLTKSAEDQIAQITRQLAPILPMSFEKVKIAVKIPPEYTGKAYGFLRNYAPQKEEWGKGGELMVLIQIPMGLKTEFFEKLNSITKGNVETKILEGS